MRDEEDQFLVHGHHSIVYPIELPPWLPLEVYQKMVGRFRGYLRDKLDTIVCQANHHWQSQVGHRRCASVESESALSTITDASDRSAFTG